MSMTTTSLFQSNTTQAVRLPKAVAFDPSISTVTIRKVGTARIISPKGSSWDEWFDRGGGIGDDFMPNREQGEMQERSW